MSGITQTYTTYITDDAGRVRAIETNAQTGISEEEYNVTSPGEDDVVVPLTIAFADLIAFWAVSDQDVTMTVNADALVVSLVANVPYWWATGKGTNPIDEDITSVTFANAGTTDATVKGAFLSAEAI